VGRDLPYNIGGTVIPLLSFLGLVSTGIVCVASSNVVFLRGSWCVVMLAAWFHLVWVVGPSGYVVRSGRVLVRDSGACILVVEVEWLEYCGWWSRGCNLVYMVLLLT
jgi:hypothetical protein